MPNDVLLLTAASVEIRAQAGKQPTFSALAYGGSPMVVAGSLTLIDTAGADTRGVIPVLLDHDNAVGSLVGQGQGIVRGGQIHVAGVITDATDAGKTLIALARSGVTPQVSIGFQPTKREFIRPGQTIRANGREHTVPDGGLVFIAAGKLRELSVVAIGADEHNSLSISAKKGNPPMSTDNVNADTQPEPQSDVERALELWNRTKFSSENIRGQCEKFLQASLSGKLGYGDFENELLKARVRDLELKAIRDARPQYPGPRPSQRGDGASSATCCEAALLCHLGFEPLAAKQLGDEATQRGRDLRATSLVEILQAAWRGADREPPHGREQLIRASFSTVDIANIVGNTQNKVLLDVWQRLPLLSRTLSKRVSAKDFKAGTAVRLGVRGSAFDELAPAGEIKHGTLSDSAASFKLSTYARMYSLTRTDIINDDLNALAALPQAIARGAGLKLESLFWQLVLGNSGSYFGSGNSNILVDVLDVDGLAAAVALLRNMVDGDGEPLLAEPRYLVVGPTQETLAQGLFSSLNLAVAGDTNIVQPSGNVFANKYLPLTSPYIENANYTGFSTTKWFLFCDPLSGGPAAFLTAFLNGVEQPTIEQSDMDFDKLGVQFRGFVDMAVGQLDSQGGVMSTGAGA